MKFVVSIALILIGIQGVSQDRVKKIDSFLDSLYAKGKFHGNVLIAEKGEVLYSKSFGLANEVTKEKLDENSIFELASVSKQFTAMAVLILSEKGKLKLDDKITKYIPELSHYPDVTIRNLLNHTGGLPDYMGLMDTLFDKKKIATNKDIVFLFSKHKPLARFQPDTKFEYSNTGYALLATIIEKASGNSFAEYLEKMIFKPLKMENTFVYTRRLTPKNVKNYAFGYVYSDSLKKFVLPDDIEKDKVVIWLDGIVGDGTVNSTVKDLLKWDRALYTDQLISNEIKKDVFKAATLNDKSLTKYGYGWQLEDNNDFGKIAKHSGGWPGYYTYLERHTDNDKTIIILQNHDGVSLPVLSLRNILYNKPLQAANTRKEVSLSMDQLRKVTGTYEIQPGVELRVFMENDQLLTQLTGQKAFPLFAESETSFFLKVVDAQLRFDKNEEGEIIRATLFQNGNTVPAKKISN